MTRSAKDSVLDILQGIVAFPFQAQEAADDIARIYADWNDWCDILHGRHGCYTEFCQCDKVIERATQRGWAGSRRPDLPSVPLPVAREVE